MSDIETEITPDLGDEPSFEPEGEQWAPSRDEWEDLRSGIGYVAAEMQARQQAAQAEYAAEQEGDYRAALEDAFDPYSEGFDPERAMAMVEEVVQAQIAPVQQELAERQYQDALADAEDLAFDELDRLGVPEEQQYEVVAAASSLLNEKAAELVCAQQGVSVEQIRGALQSPNPSERQWGEQWAQWATDAAEQLISGNQEAALIALEEAASAVTHESQIESHYAQGGTLSDAMFGAGVRPTGQFASGDYRGGQTVSSRMFGGN